MMRKLFYTIIMAIIAGALEFSCGENIPDCPSKMCIIAGGWQLVEVDEDGVKQNIDLSKYKVILTMPSSQATEGNFARTNAQGTQDSGIWKTENKDEILLLVPASSPEEPYIINAFSPRQLILVINRDSNKVGPTQIKYIYEPI